VEGVIKFGVHIFSKQFLSYFAYLTTGAPLLSYKILTDFLKFTSYRKKSFKWKFWGFHGGDISSRGLLDCDALLSCGMIISTFQRSMLPPSSEWREHGPLKSWYPTTTLHGVTTQKTSTWNFKWKLHILKRSMLCTNLGMKSSFVETSGRIRFEFQVKLGLYCAHTHQEQIFSTPTSQSPG
jgi:hypothetical protein